MQELTPEQLAEIIATVRLIRQHRPARALIAISCDGRDVVRVELERLEGVSPTKLLRPVGRETGLT